MTAGRQIRFGVAMLVATVVLTPTAEASPVSIDQVQAWTTTKPIDWPSYLLANSPLGNNGAFTPTDASDDLPVQNTAAGAHPALNILFNVCNKPIPVSFLLSTCDAQHKAEDVNDWVLRLPPGALGNAEAAQACDETTFRHTVVTNFMTSTTFPSLQFFPFNFSGCGRDTLVGWTWSIAWIRPNAGYGVDQNGVGNYGVGMVFRLKPQGDEVARLGAVVLPPGNYEHVYVPSLIKIERDGGQYVVRTDTDLPDGIFGVPHYPLPIKLEQVAVSLFGDYNPWDSTAGGAPMDPPFWVNPTYCPAVPEQAKFDFNSNQDPTYTSLSVPMPVTDCQNVPFDPGLEVSSDTDQANTPSGYDVTLTVPGDEFPVRQSHLRRAEVTLPDGVVLNPGAADGLAACSDAQFALESDGPQSCPSASKIGDISVETPYVDGDPSTPATIDPLEGKVFFGEPKPGDPWRLFLLIDDANLRIKIAGSTHLDPATGRITSVFEDLPQTPFTRFTLHLRGGSKAILLNPKDCGPHTAQSKLTPWSGNADKSPSDAINTTGPCPAQRPFGPQANASNNPTQAGAYTKSHMQFERSDDQQLVTGLNLSLPAGLAGSLADVPLCGAADALAGTCSQDSKIATVSNVVGTDGSSLPFPGSIYLAAPVDPADVASLSVVVPSKVGPIDLGNVVLISHIRLRQQDGGLDVLTSGLPTIFEGVPLSIKQIEIDVDRDAFLKNPTGCSVRYLVATFSSSEGAVSQDSAASQATGCERQGFSPKLRLIAEAKGQTKRFAHTALRAIVTQTAGEANIATARVVLPDIIRPDNVPLLKPGGLCKNEELIARACPGPSQVGSAVAYTPLLPQPLSGPVYVVQDPASPLPKLAVLLSGMAAIELDASNALQGLHTVNTFNSVPDVAVSRFELFIKGGSNGILKNFYDLCSRSATADAAFWSHSGAVSSSKPPLEVEGCATSSSKAKLRIPKRASVDRRGVVRMRLRCSGARCKGRIRLKGRGIKASKRFKIARSKRKTIKLRLSRSERRRVFRHRRGLKVKARISLKGGASKASTKKVTLRRKR